MASYDRRGRFIFTGNSKGRVLIVSRNGRTEDGNLKFKTVSSFKVTQAASSTTAIKSIEFSRRTESFLVNTSDRIIRVYKTDEVLKFQNGK